LSKRFIHMKWRNRMSTVARLRALVAVADCGSVREAARRLTVTESAVSAALAALAREVRVPLVERQGRGVRLTGPGRAYAGYGAGCASRR
jgi:DNA-binding transcriptional LysR family regulator